MQRQKYVLNHTRTFHLDVVVCSKAVLAFSLLKKINKEALQSHTVNSISHRLATAAAGPLPEDGGKCFKTARGHPSGKTRHLVSTPQDADLLEDRSSLQSFVRANHKLLCVFTCPLYSSFNTIRLRRGSTTGEEMHAQNASTYVSRRNVFDLGKIDSRSLTAEVCYSAYTDMGRFQSDYGVYVIKIVLVG